VARRVVLRLHELIGRCWAAARQTGGTKDCGEHREAAGAFATTLVHALGDPNSPVCKQDEVKLFLGYGVHPAADSTSARKCESVFAVAVDNGEFHIAVERSGIYWLPVHNEFIHHKLTSSVI
jgi:hypothetical protein